jgi:hypothetical protein
VHIDVKVSNLRWDETRRERRAREGERERGRERERGVQWEGREGRGEGVARDEERVQRGDRVFVSYVEIAAPDDGLCLLELLDVRYHRLVPALRAVVQTETKKKRSERAMRPPSSTSSLLLSPSPPCVSAFSQSLVLSSPLPFELRAGVWHVSVDEKESLKLGRDQAAFIVMLRNAEAEPEVITSECVIGTEESRGTYVNLMGFTRV